MKHTPNLMTAKIRTRNRAYRCIVDKYSGNRYKVVVGPSFLADREFQYGHGLVERHKLDLDEIADSFDYRYRYLYELIESSDVRDLQTRCAHTFDECMDDPAFNMLACQFANHRNDLMTSDRECASFILALSDLFIPEIITSKANFAK